MLYALTATGVLPGITQINPSPIMDFSTGTLTVTGVNFVKLAFQEIELTSYEIGSKNRFLNNRLELNAAAYYYDYEGYQEAVNIAQGGMPQFVVLSVPVEMIGFELDATWLMTESDKMWLTAGWLDAEIQSWPYLPDVGSSEQYGALDQLPGIPELTAALGYDHTFYFSNGSALVPRGELRYTDGYYLQQITEAQVELGQLPYDYQDAYVIFNVGATWTSPGGMYSVTGYVRNLLDEEYKTDVSLSTTGISGITVDVGDPQAWGLMVGVHF
jgi:iron complex outermembrane receptor protein